MSEIQTARYLPVRVAEQTYLIAMDQVLAVQSTTDAADSHPSLALVMSDAAEPAEAVDVTVPMVELSILLGGSALSRYAVMVTTPVGSCALLVEAIRAPVNVGPEKMHNLPFLLTLTGCPFKTMISLDDDLRPVLDVTQLLEHLRSIRPDLVREVPHDG